MALDLTFKDVCSAIKKQGKDDAKLIESVDKLLGLALVCSPIVIGPAALALLPTLAVKNEVVKVGKGVFDKLTKPKDEDYLLRHDTMQMAYGLIVFTSFFDALDARIPKALRDKIALVEPEKALLVKEAIAGTLRRGSDSGLSLRSDVTVAPLAENLFAFPHPTETLVEQNRRQENLWKQMSQGFTAFIQKLAFWENADEKTQAQLLHGLENIEEDAAKTFEAQYFELARKYGDFAIWANLHGHKSTSASIDSLSEYVKHHAALSAANEKLIDIGFAKLREVVQSIPETLRMNQAVELAESLNKHYQARINEPIIEDKEEHEEDEPRLKFPRVCEAFVPQAFRVLRQGGKSRRLEEESTWSGLPRRNDLGAFLLSYLSSPYSTESPLLILGHPGSGKSLLTTILAAQLMSKHLTVIRIPLREVNADADIVTQIEDGIRQITGAGIDSWIKLSAMFKNCPPLVILDGYDELLQASGQVFASYIKDAQRLQEREAEQGRPLRIFITSRVTLIDKAVVPVGATIVRLLEFDKLQRDCWSAIWNKSNANYFKEAAIEKFALPGEKDGGADKILTLAEQPLLLLMLALYDSQDNQLRKSKGLDRTKLYDSLLRRFVTRERGKEKGFNDSRQKERAKALGTEMQRLGVAALGMYNRRKVHILAPELDDDLGFFKLEREVANKSGKALSQSDLLLGSFFFVHKSKAQHDSGGLDTLEETSAFEFLHNTFGEFLTADFILRRAVAQIQALRASEESEALHSMLEKMMGTADGLERDWFASLIYTALFTRPVIMEMIREWAPHVFKEYGLQESAFVESLEKIVLNQLQRLLSKREMPSIMRKETAQEGYRVPFGDHPLIGHVAIYSINLVLLRVIVGAQPFVFDESGVTSHEDGTRPWDRLIHIWRSWFSLGHLNGITAVMSSYREGRRITVAAKKSFQADDSKSRLHDYFNVATSLADSIASGLSGLYLFQPSEDSATDLDDIELRLKSEGIDIGFAFQIKRLLALLNHLPDSAHEFVRVGSSTLEIIVRNERQDELEQVCAVISRAVNQFTLNYRYTEFDDREGRPNRFFRDLVDPRVAAEVASRDASAGRILWSLGKRLGDFDWQRLFSRRLLDPGIHEWRLRESFPAVEQKSFEWLRLIREVHASSAFSQSHESDRFIDAHFEEMVRSFAQMDIVQRSPQYMLAYMQTVREIAGNRLPGHVANRRVGQMLREIAPSSRQLSELSGSNPDEALVYFQLLHEMGGEELRERFFDSRRGASPTYQVFDAKQLLELSHKNPRGVLIYLATIGVSESQPGLFPNEPDAEWRPHLFAMLLSSNAIQQLSAGEPNDALSYFDLLSKVARYFDGDIAAMRLLRDVMRDRMVGPRQFFDLSVFNPDIALAYVHVLSQTGCSELLDSYTSVGGANSRNRTGIEPRDLFQIFTRNPQTIGLWAAIARRLATSHITESVQSAISEYLSGRSGARSGLAQLPLSTLVDLRWLAANSGSSELTRALNDVLANPDEFSDGAVRPRQPPRRLI